MHCFSLASALNGKRLDFEGQEDMPGGIVVIWSEKPYGTASQLWYTDRDGVIYPRLKFF